MKSALTLWLFSLTLLSAPLFAADVSESELQMLREQIKALSERLDQLERSSQDAPGSPASTAITQSGTASVASNSASDEEMQRKIDSAVDAKVEERMAAVSWAERLRWSGDFRFRYENIEAEGKDSRTRERIRARVQMLADVSDTINVGFGLATGGDDPVSTNQTIGGGGSSKPISLDLAYFEWTGLENVKVVGGKFKQQQHSIGDSALLWDSDWRPEGTSVRYENGGFYAVGLGTWIESDSSRQQEFSYGLQAAYAFPLSENSELQLGAGYYHFNTKGKNSFFSDGEFFGNSFNPVTNTYLYDYYEVEGFAEFTFSLFDRPTLIFADYVQNLEVDENDVGYAFGFSYNEAKRKGSWELGYMYKKLEADAVLGLLTDSDFGGGGTNAKGSVFNGAYAFHDNWNFRMTYFLNQTGIASNNSKDFDRLMLDLQFKYK